MTDNTNVTTTETAPKAPKVVKHIDVRIAEAKDAIVAAQKRLEALELEAANRGKLDTIAAGQTVNFNFGRADKARTLTGTVTAVGTDEKGNKVVAVSVGEGISAELYKIPATSVIFEA